MRNHSVIILAATLAIAGCAKFSASAPDNESDQLISFQAATYTNSTKADPVPDGYEKMTSMFKVIALYTGSEGWATIDLAEAISYMSNVMVRKSGDAWIPQGNYYWPKTGKLSFIGFSSANYGLTANIDQTNLHQFFQIGFDVDKDPYDDLLVSDITIDKTADNAKDKQYEAEGVPMLFHHVLSKINFNAKLKPKGQNNDNITHYAFIKSMSIKQVYTKGNFVFDASSKTELNGAWTPVGNAVDKNELYTNSTAVQEIGAKYSASGSELSTTDATSLLSDNDGMLVLPQTLTDNAVVELSYVIYFCNDNGTILDIYEGNNETFRLNTFKLSGASDPLNEWEQNKVYNYTIIVDPNSPDRITFDPAVAYWGEEEAEREI